MLALIRFWTWFVHGFVSANTVADYRHMDDGGAGGQLPPKP
jgi:hypothetical protein